MCLVFFPFDKDLGHRSLLFDIFFTLYTYGAINALFERFELFESHFSCSLFSDNLSMLGVLLIRGTGRKMK